MTPESIAGFKVPQEQVQALRIALEQATVSEPARVRAIGAAWQTPRRVENAVANDSREAA